MQRRIGFAVCLATGLLIGAVDQSGAQDDFDLFKPPTKAKTKPKSEEKPVADPPLLEPPKKDKPGLDFPEFEPKTEPQIEPKKSGGLNLDPGDVGGKQESPLLPDADAESRRIKTLEDVIAELRKTIEQQDAEIADLKRQLGSVGGGSGERTAARPVNGTLYIQNMTNLTRDVRVNDKTYRIRPGTAEIPLAHGEVTTQILPSQEPVNWGSDQWKTVGDRFEMTLRMAF